MREAVRRPHSALCAANNSAPGIVELITCATHAAPQASGAVPVLIGTLLSETFHKIFRALQQIMERGPDSIGAVVDQFALPM